MGNDVLDSLQHLPEVIRPEHIKVNLNGNVADRGKIIPPKEKDNIYHRTIVKSKLSYNHLSYRGHLGKFECEQTSDAEVLKPSDNQLHSSLHNSCFSSREQGCCRCLDLLLYSELEARVCHDCHIKLR
jgi:hypothetical protein